MTSAGQYRADIDGLRAVAVVSVLLFHAGFAHFQGGYVGVDVFFVISGFLITRIIARELASDSFSLAHFYERRARRILPALLVVLALTIAGAAILFSARQFRSVGESVVATSLFTSNFRFWRLTGYFAPQAERLPLLHTWSLAVEEQFYIIFPLLLFALHRWMRGRLAASLVTLWVISLVMGLGLAPGHPTAAFYFMPTRAWELLSGAVIATRPPWRALRVGARETIAAAGLAMIVASVLFLRPDMPFAAAAGLPATIGAALLIHVGLSGGSTANRLLAVRPLVGIGLISYSLYLLHWPILTFARTFMIVELTVVQRVVLLVVIGLLATVLWRVVEEPFRSPAVIRTPVAIGVAAGGTIAFLLAGLLIVERDGFSDRFAAFPAVSEPRFDAEWKHWGECARHEALHAGEVPCTLGVPGTQPTFILWGDSHTQVLATSVSESARRRRASGYLTNADGCPPALGIERSAERWCDEFNDGVMRFLAERPGIRTVILAARWSLYASGRYRTEKRAAVVLHDVLDSARGGAENSIVLARGLSRTVHRLLAMGRRVVIVDPIPEIGYDVPSAFVVGARTGRDVNSLIAPSWREYERRNSVVLGTVGQLAMLPGVQVVRPSNRLCDHYACRVELAGRLLYRDDNHLSTFGARLVAPEFDSLFLR